VGGESLAGFVKPAYDQGEGHDMGREVQFETVIEQAMRLTIKDQLQLISDLSATLSQQFQVADQGQKTSADFYGVMRGVTYDEVDFEAAQWRPADEALRGD